MKFEEWWATLTASEQKLIGRTNAKFVWMEACEACAKVVENHALGYAEPVWAFKLIDTIRARGNQ